MRVREAREDELDAVATVIAAGFEDHLPAVGPGASRELGEGGRAYRADLVDVRSRWGTSTLLVADDGALAGAVTLVHPGASGWPDGWAAMRLLAVPPARRGTGVGRALAGRCVALARERGWAGIGLHTITAFAVARAMYGRMGFVRRPERDEWPVPEIHAEAWALSFARHTGLPQSVQ